MIITAEIFKRKTGREPSEVELERVNCCRAGRTGHWACGWCMDCNRPVSDCGHIQKVQPVYHHDPEAIIGPSYQPE